MEDPQRVQPAFCHRGSACEARRDREFCAVCGVDIAAYLKAIEPKDEPSADSPTVVAPVATPAPQPVLGQSGSRASELPERTATVTDIATGDELDADALGQRAGRRIWRQRGFLIATAAGLLSGILAGVIGGLV